MPIDLEAKNWPRWKILLGIYPTKPDEGLKPGEPDDDELLEKPQDEDEEGEPEDEGEEPEDEDVGLGVDGDDEELDEYEAGDDEESDDDGYDEDEEGEEEAEQPEPLPQFVLGKQPDYKIQLDPLDNREFQSWHEFVECATDESLYAWKTKMRASHEADSENKRGQLIGTKMPWHGTATWDECVRMATRTGWPEGRKMLEESLAIVRPRPEPFRSIEMSVAGAFPMVPNYCAGDPECMVIDPGADMRHSRPIIRIDFNNWTNAYVKPEDMMLRGAAVVSLAETLERHGYSTELRIVGNSRAGNTDFRYSIVFKKAGEPLDLDRAAFAIAHPATMRRLCFAILEQHPEAEHDYRFSYGYPLYQPNDPTSGQPGGAIFVKPSQGHETKETARAAVNKAAEQLLQEIELSETTGGNDD